MNQSVRTRSVKIRPPVKLAAAILTATLLPLSGLFVAPALCLDDQLVAIREQFFKGEYARAISMYSKLPSDLRDSPLVKLWVGQSYFRTHDFEHARELMQKADEGNLQPAQKQRAQNVLSNNSIRSSRFAHPFSTTIHLMAIQFGFMQKTQRGTKSLATQMPTFLARAKEAFGNSNAFIAMYFCEDRDEYNNFFETLSSAQRPGKETPRVQGLDHMVLFCRYFPNGAEIGQNDKNDLYFRVLHEYSHALCNTIYGDHFKMPQWLNEGMADYFGWKYKPNGGNLAKVRLQKVASMRRAMTYEELSNDLYKDGEMGYAAGDVMVDTLFANKPISLYAQIIQSARSSNGNFDYAVRQVTGHDPKETYSQTVRAYWKH